MVSSIGETMMSLFDIDEFEITTDEIWRIAYKLKFDPNIDKNIKEKRSEFLAKLFSDKIKTYSSVKSPDGKLVVTRNIDGITKNVYYQIYTSDKYGVKK